MDAPAYFDWTQAFEVWVQKEAEDHDRKKNKTRNDQATRRRRILYLTFLEETNHKLTHELCRTKHALQNVTQQMAQLRQEHQATVDFMTMTLQRQSRLSREP